MRTIIFIACTLLIAANTYAQLGSEGWNDYYNEVPVHIVHDTIRIHDTTHIYISNLNDITREFGLSYDQYVRTFLKFKEDMDTLNQLSTDKIYLNYFLPLLSPGKDFISKRMVTREYSVSSNRDGARLKLTKHPYADSIESTAIAADCMLTFYGSDNTDSFLSSPSQIKSCMGELFADIYQAKGRIKGINLYFPDFSFSRKKEMAQFLKSVSLVVDSSRIHSIRGISLYASFDKRQSTKEENFLCGLAQMVDSIFILEYATENNTLPNISVISKLNAKKLGLLSKLRNQRYMSKFYTANFPITSSTEFRVEDIYNLLDADYPDNYWESYLFALICIGLIIIALVALYVVSPDVSYYINKNMDYVYSLIAMVVLEVLLLLASMYESMSNDNVFTMSSENRHIILLLPLLFILIVPMIKAIERRKRLP